MKLRLDSSNMVDIRFHHAKFQTEYGSTRGTICYIYLNNVFVSKGISSCYYTDSFVKRKGLMLSYKKAMKIAEHTLRLFAVKKNREKIWRELFPSFRKEVKLRTYHVKNKMPNPNELVLLNGETVGLWDGANWYGSNGKVEMSIFISSINLSKIESNLVNFWAKIF